MSHARTSTSGSPLRRIRSAGDSPTTQEITFAAGPASQRSDPSPSCSTVITIPKTLSRGPQSAGPSFTHPTFLSESTSERRENGLHITSTHTRPPPAALPQSTAEFAIPPLPSNLTQDRPPLRQYPPHSAFIFRLMSFLGYGRGASRTRRLLVTLVWNLSWGLAQMIAIVAVLASSATKASPTVPGANEWIACDRPLGVWSCLWLIRVVVACILSYWGWVRDNTAQSNPSDAEAGVSADIAVSSTSDSRLSTRRPSSGRNDQSSGGAETLPHTLMFRRLSLFSSLFSLSWFLTAHILVYTSVRTCRFSSPHIWWLIFGILCITYLMILEVVILGLLLLVVTPIVILVWNLFLLCIGRHPLQNPHIIKPEIGKLPKTLVDQIPLVMYIPPPPDAPLDEGPVKIPEAVYSYPPKPPTATSLSKKRFKFIRRKLGKKVSSKGSTTNDHDAGKKESARQSASWEDNWEAEGYPFVILDSNRAACAVCLMDFEEPKRIHRDPLPSDTNPENSAHEKKGEVITHTQEVIVEERREDQLQLEDAGDGAQPLRLLKCGHVFHKTCLDPWLTEVSGRCPVCQRPVDIPVRTKKKKGGS